MTSTPGFDAYPVLCRFPRCEHPAPLVPGVVDVSLCVEHERLRFYHPEEFEQLWSLLDPE